MISLIWFVVTILLLLIVYKVAFTRRFNKGKDQILKEDSIRMNRNTDPIYNQTVMKIIDLQESQQ